MVCGILVLWPWIKPIHLAVEVWSLNHWTAREVPKCLVSSYISLPFVCYAHYTLTSLVLKISNCVSDFRVLCWLFCCLGQTPSLQILLYSVPLDIAGLVFYPKAFPDIGYPSNSMPLTYSLCFITLSSLWNYCNEFQFFIVHFPWVKWSFLRTKTLTCVHLSYTYIPKIYKSSCHRAGAYFSRAQWCWRRLLRVPWIGLSQTNQS